MSVYEKIVQLLKNNKFEFQSLEHQPTPTCEDSARVRGTTRDQGAKALVCIGDKKPLLVVLPCSKRLNSKKIKASLNIRDLRFATPSEVKEITTLEIGSIPPLGSLFNLPTHVDKLLLDNETIAFNAADLRKSVIMKSSDYVNLEKPTVGDFSQEP